MDYKQSCIRGVIIGLILVAAGFFCCIFGMRSTFLIALAFIFTIAGVVLGRHSIKWLMRNAAFERTKEKALNELEALFSGGGISQEQYYAMKIEILSAEYGDDGE